MVDRDKGKKDTPKAGESDALTEPRTAASRKGEDPFDDTTEDLEGEGRYVTNTPKTPVNVNITGGSVDVNLHGTPVGDTDVQGFWEYLRQRTDAISFREYHDFINSVLCGGTTSRGGATTSQGVVDPVQSGLETAVKGFNTATHFRGADAYQLLRLATEAFLLLRCGAISLVEDKSTNPTTFKIKTNTLGSDLMPAPTPPASRFGGTAMTLTALTDKLGAYLGPGSVTIPYIDTIARAYIGSLETPGSPKNSIFCDNIDAKVLQPCFIELIWSYWQEELGLVQAINAISLRFQNKRAAGDRDVLANLETHPLRPLANLLWGYVQDDDHRLTVARRSYEYEHQYGISLLGRAVPKLRAADSRSKFLESFHTLLHQAAVFYDRASNLTVRADAFPLLNALRDVHLVLAEGAHNQFRELPWEARVEMLVQQWLLSRSEIRDFLGGRPAVPYTEEWMRPVDALRNLMGWGDTSVTHFNDLAITGEKIVLSIRFGDWSDRNTTDDDAVGWATFWKPEIQRYIYAYKTVTGVDLSATTTQFNLQIDATPPSVLLQQRIARQRAR
jgi:hypothetical protein